MKKTIAAVLLAVVLTIALSTVVAADSGGVPNENAPTTGPWFGKGVSQAAQVLIPFGEEVSSIIQSLKPPAWGPGGVKGFIE